MCIDDNTKTKKSFSLKDYFPFRSSDQANYHDGSDRDFFNHDGSDGDFSNHGESDSDFSNYGESDSDEEEYMEYLELKSNFDSFEKFI